MLKISYTFFKLTIPPLLLSVNNNNNFRKRFKQFPFCHHYINDTNAQNPPESLKYFDYSHINSSIQPNQSNQSNFSLDDFIILPNHFTSLEQEFLLDQSLKKFKRILGKKVTYKDGHFDGVIHGYRECQSTHWDDDKKMNEIFNKKIFSLFPENLRWLPVHLLELTNYGGIKAHIDNVEYSGNIVAGVCLMSSIVMRLRHINNPQFYFDALLEPGCLYIQRDSIRYNFTHEIPANPTEHKFKGNIIPKLHRISLMFRFGIFFSLQRNSCKEIMEPSNEVPKRKRGRPLSKTGAMSVQSKDPVPSIPSTPEKGQTNQITKRRGRPPKNCASTPESSSFMNNGTSSTNNDAKRRIRPSVVPSSSVGREKETFVSKKGETPSSRNRLENVKEDYEIQKRGCKPRSVSVPPPNNAKANSKVNPKGNAKVERDLKRSLSREGVLSRQRKIKAPPKSSEFLEDSDDSHESSLVKSDSDQKIFLSRNQPLSRGRNERFPKNEVDNNNQFDVMPKVNRLRKPLQSDIKAFKVKKEQNDFSNKNFRGRPSSESNNKNKFDDAKGSSSTTLRKSNRSVSRGRQRRSSSESSSNETNLAQNFKKNSGKSQIRKLPIPRDLTRKRSSLKDNEGVDHSDERVTTVQRGTHLRNRSVSRGRPLSKSKAEDEKNKNSDTQDFTTKKRPEKTPLRSVSRGRQRRQTNEFVEDDNNPYQSKINMVNKMYHEIESRKSSSSEKRYGRLPSKNKSIVMTVDNKVERNRRSQTPKNQQETTETSTIKRKPSKMNKLNGLRKDPTSESLSTQKSNKKASTEMSSRITKGTQHSIKNFQNNPIKTVKKAYSEIPLESSSFNCEYTESESYSQKSNFPVKTGGKGKSSFESSPPFNESETETVPQTRLGGGLGKSIHLIPLVYYSNESESDSEFEFVHDNLDNLEFERIERIPVRGKRLFSLPPPQNNDLEIESPKELSSEEESLREKTDECTTTKIHESESELEVNSSISIVDKETTETLQKLKPERPLKNKMETNKQLQLDNSMNQVITDSEKSLDNQDLQLISKNSRNTQNNSGNLNMQMPMLIEHWSPSGIENGCKENSVDHYLYEPIERMEKKIDTMNQDDGSTELIEPSAVLWLNSTNNNNNEIVNAFRIGANDDLFIGNQFSMESSQLTSTINQDIPTESSITVPNEISLSEELSNLSNEIFDFSFFDSLLSSQENDFMDLDGNTL